jgi:putative polymerase
MTIEQQIGQPVKEQRFHVWFAAFTVAGLSCYQLFLCFINTHGLPVNNTIVAATEGMILIAVTLRVIPRQNMTELALPAFVLAYFAFMSIMREDTDPQGIRNLFIIYIMFSLGRQTHSLRDINRIVWALSIIVAFFSFFEYFFIDLYLNTFNILQYYNARGMVSEEELGYLNTNLWISGMRMSGRTMLPFLGDQRVSSIFLEPVSMGNYAVIVAMWALSFDWRDWRLSIGHFLAAAFFIIACDSRFASIVVMVLLMIRLFPFAQKAWALYLIPLIATLGLAYFATVTTVDPNYDDLPGRLAKTGVALLNMGLPEIFGVGDVSQLYDMGIPYSLVVFGVALCIFLWIVLVFMKFATAQGLRMRAMLTAYCISLLMISGTSFYSSKTAGMLWIILGALSVQRMMVKPETVLPSPPGRAQEESPQDMPDRDESVSAPPDRNTTNR